MRKAIAAALVLCMASFGAQVGLLAQAAQEVQRGAISGSVLDAGGRAVVGQEVELVEQASGTVVQTGVTGARGSYTFANVTAGEYLVRAVVAGKVSGIAVSLGSGNTVASLIVVPAAASATSAIVMTAPMAILLFGSVAAAIAAGVIVTGS